MGFPKAPSLTSHLPGRLLGSPPRMSRACAHTHIQTHTHTHAHANACTQLWLRPAALPGRSTHRRPLVQDSNPSSWLSSCRWREGIASAFIPIPLGVCESIHSPGKSPEGRLQGAEPTDEAPLDSGLSPTSQHSEELTPYTG